MSSAAEWGRLVAHSFAKNDAVSLAKLLDPASGALQLVQREPGINTASILAPLKQHARRPEHGPFVRFLTALVDYWREAGSADPSRAFELLDAASQPAQLVLRESSTPWFAPAVKVYIRALLHLAIEADGVALDRFESDYTDKRQKSVSSRLFNMIGVCADEDATSYAASYATLLALAQSLFSPQTNKRVLILFFVNTLYRIFFDIRADMQQFTSIDTRLRGVRDFLDNIDRCSKADQVTFGYFKGRADLLQRRLTRAMHHLRTAFDLCTNAQPDNKRRILIYLAAVSICRGRLPAPQLLQAFRLDRAFLPLLTPLTKGDFRSCAAALDAVKEQHLQWGTYFLLHEKMEVTCWRSLVRRVFLLLPEPVEPGRPPQIPFRSIAAAARVAFGEDDIDAADAECICASMSEQHLVRGYCAHRQGVLVLSAKGEPFTPIAHLNTETFS